MELRRQRIHDAQRTGLRNRIRDQWHVAEERADALIEQWEQQSAPSLRQEHLDYWAQAEAWIRGRVEPRAPDRRDAES